MENESEIPCPPDSQNTISNLTKYDSDIDPTPHIGPALKERLTMSLAFDALA